MTDQTYRIKTDQGLSKQYTLQRLFEKHAAGVVEDSVECTADDGASWASLGQLFKDAGLNSAQAEAPNHVVVATADESEIAVESDLIKNISPNSESASIAQSETTVDIANDPDDDEDAAQRKSRRLKRLPAGSGTGKLSRLKVARDQRKEVDLISKPEDLIGASLANDRYKVIDKLGKGSMAYVLRASDSRLLTDVVVKVPKPEKMTDDDIRDRFRRESQLLVQLSHPHVVTVLDVGEYRELPYVVMQLLSGGTLTDLIQKGSKRSKGMEPESLKSWLREVSRALDFCYRKGMVHRDVKPANILFDEDGNAFVSDFGLTKIMYGDHDNIDPSDTASGVVLGTPNYISPEVVLGKPYDGRADQYSLGITVYHSLFGKAPMQGDNATATMINQTQKKLQLLSDIRSDVPRELALAVRKSISKKPEDRFDSCEDFAEAVIEGLRAPLGKTTVTVPTGSDESARTRASSQSSIKRKAPANRNTSSRSGRARPKRSANPDLEWLDIADGPIAQEALPPRKGKPTGERSSPKKSKKATESNTQIFGQSVHPVLIVVLGIGLCALLLSAFVRWAMSDPDPGPDLAYGNATDLGIDTTSPEYTGMAGTGGQDAFGNGNNKPKGNSKKKQNSSNSKKNNAQLEKSPPNPRTEVAASPTVPLTTPGLTPGMEPAAPSLQGTLGGLLDSATSPPTTSASTIPTGDGDVAFTIPFQPGEKITVGPPGCPIMVVGNRVWDKNSGSVRATLEEGYANGAFTALSSDGGLFAAADRPPNQQGTNVIVWDTKTGSPRFTTKGNSGQYADAILLSQKSLHIGGRWSDELLTWDVTNGNQRKALKVPAARTTHGNAAVSHNGEFIAAVADSRMVVLNTSGGKVVGHMRTPTNRPGNSLRKAAENRQKDEGNEQIYASLQSLSFSPDNLEIAGIATHPEPRLLCWNNRGELIVDGRIPFVEPNGEAVSLDWFPDGTAWLVGNRLVHRPSGRIVLATNSGSRVRVYDMDHVCGTFAGTPSKLAVKKISWDAINESLSVFTNSTAAHVSPGKSVSVDVNLSSSDSRVRDRVRKAIAERLASDGLKVEDQPQAVVFRLSDDDRDDSPTLAVVVSGESAPVWSVTLGTMPAIGEMWQDANEEARETMLADLESQIHSTITAYFVPKDPTAAALPVVLN